MDRESRPVRPVARRALRFALVAAVMMAFLVVVPTLAAKPAAAAVTKITTGSDGGLTLSASADFGEYKPCEQSSGPAATSATQSCDVVIGPTQVSGLLTKVASTASASFTETTSGSGDLQSVEGSFSATSSIRTDEATAAGAAAASMAYVLRFELTENTVFKVDQFDYDYVAGPDAPIPDLMAHPTCALALPKATGTGDWFSTNCSAIGPTGTLLGPGVWRFRIEASTWDCVLNCRAWPVGANLRWRISFSDASPPSVSIDDLEVLEGESPKDVQLTVRLSKPAPDPVSVAYSTFDGTALAGEDYDLASGTVLFAKGDQTKTITVRVRGDSLEEPDEHLTVSLGTPTGASRGDGTATVTLTNDDPQAIVFVHGFAGSRLFCNSTELWLDFPGPELPQLNLASDGVTDASSCTVTTLPGLGPEGLVLDAGGGDIYQSTVDFLRRIAPERSFFYSWDWRKSPERAVAGLDLAVEAARCGGTLPAGRSTCADPTYNKVVLMAHSMGGLVTRWYVEEPTRAAKVARVLTVGTPYWGAPKAFFSLAAGVEKPQYDELLGLDLILDNDEFRDFARNLTGEYYLWPSKSYGSWLSQKGRGPAEEIDHAALPAWTASELGGNAALVRQAIAGHEQHLDGFEANGTDYRVVVGTGIPTITRVKWLPGPISLLDRVLVEFGSGDGTVPARSATQGDPGTADPLGDNITIGYSCNVRHIPLPGAAPITNAVEDFLLEGADFGPGLATPCPARGQRLDIFRMSLGRSGLVKIRSRADATAMTPAQAEDAGLIDFLDLGQQQIIVTDADRPVELSIDGRDAVIVGRSISGSGEQSAPIYYEAVDGRVTLDVGTTVAATAGGKAVGTVGRDAAAPRSIPVITPSGRNLAVTFRVTDRSPVAATVAAVGSRSMTRATRAITVAPGDLATLSFASSDLYGNTEAVRRVLGARSVTRTAAGLSVTVACPSQGTARCTGTFVAAAGRRALGTRDFSVKSGKTAVVTVRAFPDAGDTISVTTKSGGEVESIWQGVVRAG